MKLCSQSCSANPHCLHDWRGQGVSAFTISGTSASATRVPMPGPWGAAVSWHTPCCTQEQLLLTGLLFPSPITPGCRGCVCTRTARGGRAGCSKVLISIRAQNGLLCSELSQPISFVRVGLLTRSSSFAVPRLLDLRKRELAGRALEAWALVPALPQDFQEKDLGCDPFPAHSCSSSQWRRSCLHLPSAQGQS